MTEIDLFTLATDKPELLMTTDYVVIAIYLIAIVVMGCMFARGQKNSDDYFLASRRMHWFPLALSIWASLTSANSMLGAPSYGYSQDMQQVPMMLTGLMAAVLVIYLILPLLHRLQLTTAYTYLEHRYSLPVRCGGSLLFILLRGGWLASVIYLPSLALSAVIPIEAFDKFFDPVAKLCGTNGSTFFWIVLIGVGSTIYTTLGGLKAVIWTDVIQFFVFVIGLVAIWFMLISELPDGLGTLMRELGHVPRAYVGEDRTVAWGQLVEIDGSKSRKFQDDVSLEYEWTQIEIGEDSPQVDLKGSDTPRVTFRAPQRPQATHENPRTKQAKVLALTFALRVKTTGDPPLQSPPAAVEISVADQSPLPAATMDADPSAAGPGPAHFRPRDTWFDFRWHMIFGSGVTFWLLFFSNITGRINDAGTDQIALQRYFSAPTLKGSQRAIWLNAICDVPLMPILFLTGSGVLVYYAVFQDLDVTIKAGQAMPYFVAHKLNDLVPGLAGLFIAALFAATMSSIDSGINSISAAIITDWYRRLFVRRRDERHYLNAARLTTMVLGLFATFAAVFLGQLGEAWQIAVKLMGFFTGPLLGIFLLGFFTTRSNSLGVIIGAVTGLICTIIFTANDGNEFLYSIVGLVPTVIVGYLASYLSHPPKAEKLEHLTNWSKRA